MVAESAQGTDEKTQAIIADLVRETAQFYWVDLQRFYARGRVLHVANGANLLEIAAILAQDKAALFKSYLDQGMVALATDDNAKAWVEANAQLWTVVVAPWILVQQER